MNLFSCEIYTAVWCEFCRKARFHCWGAQERCSSWRPSKVPLLRFLQLPGPVEHTHLIHHQLQLNEISYRQQVRSADWQKLLIRFLLSQFLIRLNDLTWALIFSYTSSFLHAKNNATALCFHSWVYTLVAIGVICIQNSTWGRKKFAQLCNFPLFMSY